MFDGLRARISTMLTKQKPVYTRQVMPNGNIIEKYDQNWFLRFLNIAHQEDIDQGEGVTDVMRQHAWANIGINAIARNIARAKFEIISGDTVVEAGPVYDLFTFVNPQMSRFQLWEATVAWKKCTGEAFWIFEPGYTTGIPTEIYLVNPEYMKHTVDPVTRRITMWKFERDRVEIPFLPDELIHFREWNKWDDYRGVNPLIAQSNEIVTDRQAGISNYRMIANGSRPEGVLSTDQNIDEKRASEIVDRWEKNHRGASRAHRISVLGSGTTWQSTAMSPRDMEYGNSKKWNRATVLGRLGVPPGAVGVKDDNTPLSGTDTREQMKSFWNLTLIPELIGLQDKMRTEFFKRYKIPYDCQFNLDDIDELQDDEVKKHELLRADTKEGLLTINEAREAQGLDPVPWGDTWWKPMGLSDVQQKDEPKSALPIPGVPPEKPKKIIHVPIDVFANTGVKLYTENYKTKHWQIVIKAWESEEKKYEKDLREWFYSIRLRTLTLITSQHKEVKIDPDFVGPGESEYWQIIRDMKDELLAEQYFNEKAAELAAMSETHFIAQMEITGEQIKRLFQDLGLETAASFDIYDTGALNFLKKRVTKVKGAIVETVRDQIRDTIDKAVKGGWTETETAAGVRDVFNKAGNRAATIARTELGGIIGDSRDQAFRNEGFEWKEWLSSRDRGVRVHPYNHMLDGEIVKIDEYFSNGLLYPNDPEGDAANVINCRCLHLPSEKGPEG